MLLQHSFLLPALGDLLVVEDVEPLEQAWLLVQGLLVLDQGHLSVSVHVDRVEDVLERARVHVGLRALETAPVRHELPHDRVHVVEGDVAVLVLVEHREAELVLLFDRPVLVNVDDRGEFLEGHVLVSILVGKLENSVAEERVAALAQKTENLPELLQVHESGALHLFGVLLLRDLKLLIILMLVFPRNFLGVKALPLTTPSLWRCFVRGRREREVVLQELLFSVLTLFALMLGLLSEVELGVGVQNLLSVVLVFLLLLDLYPHLTVLDELLLQLSECSRSESQVFSLFDAEQLVSFKKWLYFAATTPDSHDALHRVKFKFAYLSGAIELFLPVDARVPVPVTQGPLFLTRILKVRPKLTPVGGACAL